MMGLAHPLVFACAVICSSGATGCKAERPGPATDESETTSSSLGEGEPPRDLTAHSGPLDDPSLPDASELAHRLAQFAPAVITADIDDLPASERKALDLIIEAARELDPIFDQQAWTGNYVLERRLERREDGAGKLRLQYFRIMRGPWDRQNEHEPFAVTTERPPGAGYYPEDLTADEFRSYVKKHPSQKDALESLFTMVKREGNQLIAIPYSEHFERWLEPAAEKLEAAAAATRNASLATFLRARAEAFRTDDYYASDKAWMDLDSRVEVTIGPYETYEDQLLGLKAAFEAFVTVSDPAASRRLAKYKSLLPAMEANLPVPDSVKTKRGSESPIRVVDLVFSSGDARKSVQTIAFNLPNDERVRKEKGAKKVLLRNLIETKFEKILKPIGEQILVEAQASKLRGRAFFNQVLFHELSHSLGPAFTEVDGERREVRFALGSSYSPIEECKADVMGAYNVLFMIDRGELPKTFREPFLLTYFAGLFRSIRFGVTEAHGRGAAIQINRFIAEEAATFDDESERFTVDIDQLERSIRGLTKDLIMLQHEGDKDGVDDLIASRGELTPPVRAALAKTRKVPVDIRPLYPLAGESTDP